MKKNSITTITTITEAAKQSLLRLCNHELQKREVGGAIDVDIEYIKRKEEKLLEFKKNLVAGFLASAITMAVLSYSFIIFAIIYLFVNNH
jgi:hypothetical protein